MYNKGEPSKVKNWGNVEKFHILWGEGSWLIHKKKTDDPGGTQEYCQSRLSQYCLSSLTPIIVSLLSVLFINCFLSMIDAQIKASLWRRSRTDFNTSKDNIVDFYFLQQNHFPWRMRVFHCCRRLLLHNITRRTIGEQISIECFGFGRNDSFDI